MSQQVKSGGVLINRLNRLNSEFFDLNVNSEKSSDIDSSELASIVFTVLEAGTLETKDIQIATGIPKSTLTDMLDRLEGKGWVRRERCTEDRRKIKVRLVKSRKYFFDQFGPIIAKQQEVFYKGFSSEEIDQFDKLLDRACINFNKALGKIY